MLDEGLMRLGAAKSSGDVVRIGDVDEDDNSVRKDAKQRLARRVYRLMIAKGWNQSELARRADIGRDSVSSYLRKKQFPEPPAQEKLARAFGMTVEELMLGGEDAVAMNPASTVEMRESRPGMALLKINKEVPSRLAAQILSLLVAAEAAEE